MARVLLIFNPVAARTDPEVVTAVTRVFAGEGWHVDVAGTSQAGHAADLARRGVDDGMDLVAVYGGDGTTMQAVRGIVGRGVPVALIPGGTGNVLAGNLRLPRRPADAARVAVRGVTRRIDLGRVRRSHGERYFAVSCGAGFDAELMAGTTGELKRRWGMGAYFANAWSALRELTVVAHRVTVDGEPFESDAAMVLVANCGEIFPPWARLKPGIAPDDGYLDVIIANAAGLMESVDVVMRLLAAWEGEGERVRFLRGTHVIVETGEPRPVQLDGEPDGETPLEAEIVPGALDVVVTGG
ncbi:MAG: diacylglycerol kinase family lipid kinase [Gemmatimonadales bacterium]|jgi:YegS/Rv2252/BmrU family lipid kinase